MDHPSKKPGRIAPRFSLRHLLLAMTAASVLMGLATLLPRDALWFILRLADLGLVAGLVAGVMVCTGRLRIACVATLVPLAVAAFGEPALGGLFDDFSRLIRRLGAGPGILDIRVFALRWAEAALSGVAAYVIAGWLAEKK